MTAMPSPAQSEVHAGLLPVEPSIEAPPVSPAEVKIDRLPNRLPSRVKRASLALVRFLITFCIGIASTLAWQSYGDVARAMIASSHPQLGWFAPQAEPVGQNAPGMIAPAAPIAPSLDRQQLNAMLLDLDAVRQSIDRIATSIAADQVQTTRSADRIAIRQEQITQSVDQFAAGLEQITREITKLQEIEQYILYKNSEPTPRPAPAPVRNPVPRPSQAPVVR
jgi:hypothetical protein